MTIDLNTSLPSLTLEKEEKKKKEGRQTGSQLLTQRYQLLQKMEIGSLTPAAIQLMQSGQEGQIQIAKCLRTLAQNHFAAQEFFSGSQESILERISKNQSCNLVFTPFQIPDLQENRPGPQPSAQQNEPKAIADELIRERYDRILKIIRLIQQGHN